MIQVPVDDEVEVQIGEDNQIAARKARKVLRGKVRKAPKGGAHKVKALRDKVREAEAHEAEAHRDKVREAEAHEAETHEAEVRGELVLELGGEVVVKAPQQRSTWPGQARQLVVEGKKIGIKFIICKI